MINDFAGPKTRKLITNFSKTKQYHLYICIQ